MEGQMNLVVGATGNVGGAVCELLRGQEKPVRAMVRETSDPQRVSRLEQIGAEVVLGELRDPGSLARACEGVATAISGATTIGSLGTDSISAVDRDGQLALVDAARSAGVQHFIYISYTRHVDTDDPLTQAKRAVEERLRASGMAFTILRPSYFMEMWLGPALGWDLEGGRAQVLGSGEQRVNWISAHDVAAAVVACVDHPDAHEQTIELGGPEALSPLEVVHLAESITNREIGVEHVPVEALEQQASEAAGSDAAIFPSLMLCQTRGDEIEPCADWLRPRTTVADYLNRALA
jgi:NADH dehydrogenase